MQIINKTFSDFRVAFNNNRLSGNTKKFFLKRDDINIPIFGAAVLDGKFYVITESQEYIEVLDTDTITIVP